MATIAEAKQQALQAEKRIIQQREATERARASIETQQAIRSQGIAGLRERALQKQRIESTRTQLEGAAKQVGEFKQQISQAERQQQEIARQQGEAKLAQELYIRSQQGYAVGLSDKPESVQKMFRELESTYSGSIDRGRIDESKLTPGVFDVRTGLPLDSKGQIIKVSPETIKIPNLQSISGDNMSYASESDIKQMSIASPSDIKQMSFASPKDIRLQSIAAPSDLKTTTSTVKLKDIPALQPQTFEEIKAKGVSNKEYQAVRERGYTPSESVAIAQYQKEQQRTVSNQEAEAMLKARGITPGTFTGDLATGLKKIGELPSKIAQSADVYITPTGISTIKTPFSQILSYKVPKSISAPAIETAGLFTPGVNIAQLSAYGAGTLGRTMLGTERAVISSKETGTALFGINTDKQGLVNIVGGTTGTRLKSYSETNPLGLIGDIGMVGAGGLAAVKAVKPLFKTGEVISIEKGAKQLGMSETQYIEFKNLQSTVQKDLATERIESAARKKEQVKLLEGLDKTDRRLGIVRESAVSDIRTEFPFTSLAEGEKVSKQTMQTLKGSLADAGYTKTKGEEFIKLSEVSKGGIQLQPTKKLDLITGELGDISKTVKLPELKYSTDLGRFYSNVYGVVKTKTIGEETKGLGVMVQESAVTGKPINKALFTYTGKGEVGEYNIITSPLGRPKAGVPKAIGRLSETQVSKSTLLSEKGLPKELPTKIKRTSYEEFGIIDKPNKVISAEELKALMMKSAPEEFKPRTLLDGTLTKEVERIKPSNVKFRTDVKFTTPKDFLTVESSLTKRTPSTIRAVRIPGVPKPAKVGEEVVTVYQGTSAKYVPDILKKGLQPSEKTGIKQGLSSKSFVSTSPSKEAVKGYAVKAGIQSKDQPAIIEANIPKSEVGKYLIKDEALGKTGVEEIRFREIPAKYLKVSEGGLGGQVLESLPKISTAKQPAIIAPRVSTMKITTPKIPEVKLLEMPTRTIRTRDLLGFGLPAMVGGQGLQVQELSPQFVTPKRLPAYEDVGRTPTLTGMVTKKPEDTTRINDILNTAIDTTGRTTIVDKPLDIERGRERTLGGERTDLGIRNLFKEKDKAKDKVKLKDLQISKEIQAQPSLQEQESRLIQKPKQPLKERQVPKPKKPRIPKIIPKMVERKKMVEMLRGKGTPAFEVQVRKGGKFMTIAKGLPEQRALKKGAEEVSSTLRASFKLVPKGETQLQDIRYNLPMEKFTLPKPSSPLRGPLTYVQKPEYRLSARSEVSEILKAKKQSTGGLL